MRINYTEQNLTNIPEIIKDLENITKKNLHDYLLIDFHRVWQDDKADDAHIILDNIISKYRQAGFEVSSKLQSDSVKESCYADKKNSAIINYNGDIFKCTARDFVTEQKLGKLSSEGEIIWANKNIFEERFDAKFKNKSCLKCRIMPLCNGGCTQHAVENKDNDFCVNFYDNTIKDSIIKATIKNILHETLTEGSNI